MDNPCEVCGHGDYIAGVASSVLGPCSFNFCHICLKMRAEPKGWIEATVECCGGIENIRKGLELIYFEKDSYVDYMTKEIVPVRFKDGTEFQTRTEVVAELKKREIE